MGDRQVLFRERPISADSANRIGILLDSVDRILKREQEEAQAKADRNGERICAFPGLPEDLRWRVMVLGASVEDCNFWVRREDQDGGQWHLVTEIETGVTVGGVTEREALDNYFKGEF